MNHGGNLVKLYRFNRGVKIYLRPSIPDFQVGDDLKVKEFENGYWEFQTDTLGSSQFKDFWYNNKITFRKRFNNLTESHYKNVDNGFLEKISSLFEKFSSKTLFGLDFIYNFENKSYSLIDCNYFPGYKEIEKEFNPILTEHISYYVCNK